MQRRRTLLSACGRYTVAAAMRPHRPVMWRYTAHCQHSGQEPQPGLDLHLTMTAPASSAVHPAAARSGCCPGHYHVWREAPAHRPAAKQAHQFALQVDVCPWERRICTTRNVALAGWQNSILQSVELRLAPTSRSISGCSCLTRQCICHTLSKTAAARLSPLRGSSEAARAASALNSATADL
jgi:hypothetical protein